MYYVLDRGTGEFLKGQPFVKVNWATGFDAKGRPIQVVEPSREGTLVYPGNQGATNWYNPHLVLARVCSTFRHGRTVPRSIPWGLRRRNSMRGQNFAGAFPGRGARGDDTYSAIRALDPKTGEKKWDYRMASPSTDAGVMTTASDVLFSGGRD